MKKLNTKFVTIFVGTLACVFALLMGVLSLTATFGLGGYIKDNIYSMQRNVDGSVTKVFDECAYLYSRMMKTENVGLLNALASDAEQEEKRQVFRTLVNSAGLGEMYFQNVAYEINGDFGSLNDGFYYPDPRLSEKAAGRKNAVTTGDCFALDMTLAISVNNTITNFDGTFYFYLKHETLINVCNVFEEDTGYTFIIRGDGYVLSHPDDDYIGRSVLEGDYGLSSSPVYEIRKAGGRKSIVAVSEMSELNARYYADCYLISVLDYDVFYSEIETVVIILACLAAALFILTALLAVRQAKILSAPVADLNRSIMEVRKTGYKKPAGKADDEIGQLEKNYDEMLDRIFHLMEKEKSDLEKQRKLELDALQMQINPHFLYNTLDVIAWMAKIKKQPDIEKLVLNLAGFFRLSLHKGKQFITVADEVELVSHYLEIDKICYPEKLRADIRLEEGLGGYTTLKLILQPIVENVTKYAFPDNGGHLSVRVYSDGDDIVYSVVDDGVGFDYDPDILSFKPDDGTVKGYGLYNVNERIVLEYGESYGIKIRSVKGKGTEVTVRIPKREHSRD